MGKTFKANGLMAKKILHANGYWQYYDRGYHGISLYIRGSKEDPIYTGINRDIDRWILVDAHFSSVEEQIVEHGIYELKIEHHDYDYITKAFEALMKES